MDVGDRRFKSCIPDNGFGGNPRIDDESMSTTFALVANRCRQLAFNQWGQVQLLTGVRDALSLYVYKWEVQKHTFYLDGVTGAYFFYTERVGVRFPLEVQLLGTESRSDTIA